MLGHRGRSAKPLRGSDPRPPASPARRLIEAHRRALGRAGLASGMLLALSGWCLTLGVVVAADHVWGLPRAVLSAALTGLAIVGGGGAVAALLAWRLRRIAAAFAARTLERNSNLSHNPLVNAVLISGSEAGSYAAAAAWQQADRAVSGRLWQPPAAALARWAWIALAATAIAWVALWALTPKRVDASVARIFGADLPPPSVTQIRLTRPAPDEAVYAGAALEIEFELHGGDGEALRFDVLEAADGAASVVHSLVAPPPAVAASPDLRRVTLPAIFVQGDIPFQCSAGDGTLSGVIPVWPLPAASSVRVAVTPPAYTGLEPWSATAGDLVVPAGSRVAFELIANCDIADAFFVLRSGAGETRTRMHVSAGAASSASVDLVAIESGQLTFEFADLNRVPARGVAVHRLEVVSDAPPRVELSVAPPEAEEPDGVDLARRPVVHVAASDDYAVELLTFVLESKGGEARSRLAARSSRDRRDASAAIDLATLPLAVGEQATVWVEATDGRVLPGGQLAAQTTASRRLVLVRSEPDPDTGGRGGRPQASEPRNDGNGSGDRAEPQAEPGADESDARGDEGRDGSGEAADEAGDPVDDFVREHGQEAQEIVDRLRARAQPATPPGAAGSESQPANAEPDSQPTSVEPAEPDEDSPESPTDDSTGPSPPPARLPADGATTRPDGEQSAPPGDGAPSAAEGGPGGESSGPPGQRETGAPVPASKPAHEPDPGADGSGAEEPVADGAEPDAEAVVGRPESADSAEALRRLLEWLDRGGSISEEDLVEAGWPQAKAAAFLKALERARAAAADRSADRARRLSGAARPLGRVDPQSGQDVSRELRGGPAAAEVAADRLRRIAPPAEQSVPPELQALLDAYYRSVAAGDGGRRE